MKKRPKWQQAVEERLLCLDPGIAGTGLALFQVPDEMEFMWAKVIWSNQEHSWWVRCIDITDQFARVLDSLSRYRVVVLIEVPSYWGESSRSYAAATSGDLLHLSALIGMLIWLCHKRGIEFVELPVTKWKGQLPKKVVTRRVKNAFGLDRIENHASDAAGMGLWLSKQGTLDVGQ